MTAKGQHESAADRDRRIEGQYSYHREGLDTLAYVASRKLDLADEFYRWWGEARIQNEHLEEGLLRWEVARFGAPLFRAAHGILAFEIRRAQQTTKRTTLYAPFADEFEQARWEKATRQAGEPPKPAREGRKPGELLAYLDRIIASERGA